MYGMRLGLPGFGRRLFGPIALFLLLCLALPANAARRPSWFVIDAATGQVLAENHSEELHYPASLTKLMTLYILFDEIRHQRFTFNQEFPVSRHAASREPTKLGLRPGESISLRDLILGIVTQSANDAASVIAEGVAGSEAAFAERMSAQARALGMARTVFRNASGLPDRRQVTTAHDMAQLARALMRDFPEDYKYFSVRQFRYHGRIFRNHDRLIYRYAGMDGMKTGFTNAALFNLVSSAMRGDRRLIGVVLGSPSPAARDRKMTALLDRGFATASPPVAVAARDPSLVTTSDIVATLSPISRAEAAVPRSGTIEAVALERKVERHWAIQVGVFSRRADALRFASELASSNKEIALHHRRIEAHRRTGGHRLYRVQFVDLTRSAAAATCKALHRRRRDCFLRRIDD